MKKAIGDLHYAVGYLNGLISIEKKDVSYLELVHQIFEKNEFFLEAIKDEEQDEELEDFYEEDYSDDPVNSYGRSTEKYGGYNGYSDDVIDDAFEGDPSATWNID